MGWTMTLIGLGVCTGFGLLAWWQAERAPDPTRVRLIPWTSLMIACVVIGLLFAVHLANLAGFETGQRRF
ncbi:MAG: hypothetical protein ACFB6R_09390 [Alphaproteobacteria bacterium]